MLKRNISCLAALVLAGILPGASGLHAQHPAFDNNPYFGRNDSAMYNPGSNPHGGAGVLDYMELTTRDAFSSNFIFLHRGILRPKSSIGEHAHRRMEEMYFVLDRYAEFTVDGVTSAIPSVGMVLCPMGCSHGIFNPTDHPVEWMNFGVSNDNRQYDAVNFNSEGNDLVDRDLESPPPFTWAVLDAGMLQPVERMYGGKGTVYTREVWDKDDFRSYWAYVSHYRIPRGCSIGLHRHDEMEVVYYILSGSGRGTVNDGTYDVKAGDSMSCTVNNAFGVYNNGREDIEIIAVGVSMQKGVVVDGTPLGDDLTWR